MKKLISKVSPFYPATIVYMLQASEYKVGEYLRWLKRTRDFGQVNKRSSLVRTSKAKLLLVINYVIALILLGLVAWLLLMQNTISIVAAVFVILLSPWLISHLILLPLIFGNHFIQKPKTRKMAAEAKQILSSHKGLRIAIVGSFGKTTAKEVLRTVLSEGRKVAYTPGNMNTLIGISRFIKTLDGDEDVLIFEMGEESVGDIKELCELTNPDMGIMAGINEAHLSSFGTIENTINTIFELKDYLGDKVIYKNSESPILKKQISNDDKYQYNRTSLGDMTVESCEADIDGTQFTIKKGEHDIEFKTQLLGEHNVGILLVAIDIAFNLGLNEEQIKAGISKTEPFEHRFKPRMLGGAWLIDDTYNGNSEGVAAGLAFLNTNTAKRKIYVTPGLVEQGDKTAEVHTEIGRKIAKVADVTVLMKNSVTGYIQDGLKAGGYNGELLIVEDPLSFYKNIEHFVAAGDVVLMQNDWTDNYA